MTKWPLYRYSGCSSLDTSLECLSLVLSVTSILCLMISWYWTLQSSRHSSLTFITLCVHIMNFGYSEYKTSSPQYEDQYGVQWKWVNFALGYATICIFQTWLQLIGALGLEADNHYQILYASLLLLLPTSSSKLVHKWSIHKGCSMNMFL